MPGDEETRYGNVEVSGDARIVIGMEPDFSEAHPQEAYLIKEQADDLDIPVWKSLSIACRQLTHEEV